MTSNMSKPNIDYEEVWKDVSQMEFGEVMPTNEHDRQTVKRITNVMKATRHAINNPEQMGINQERVKVFKKRMKVLKKIWIEECKVASKVDPKVPVVRKIGRKWRVYPQGDQEQ